MKRSFLVPLFLLLLLALPLAAAAAKHDDGEIVRRVRLSVRIEGDGRDARVELPLVQSDEHQQLLSEKILGRGFQVREVMQDGNRLAVLTWPKFTGRKRITYEFTVRVKPTSTTVTPAPVSDPDMAGDDAVWLRPTLNLQSTSPLIREKLIKYATPRLQAGETDAIRIAWDLTGTYVRKPKGSKTVLKATRTGHASDKGLDRLFATFLRTSGVPSRPVNGVDVGREKGRKYASWVEVKTGGVWVPMSVPRDSWGELPSRYVKLSHGDRPLVVNEGVKSMSFRWKVDKVAETAAEASK